MPTIHHPFRRNKWFKDKKNPTDSPISSGFLLTLVAYINLLFLSTLATWLGTLLSWADYILLLPWSGQDWEDWAFSFPEFSCSHCPTSTSCLVDSPILPAWLISVLLKYMIDRLQTILPHHSISYKTDWAISSSFLLTLVAYINPLFLSTLATWLGAFLSRADYILLLP